MSDPLKRAIRLLQTFIGTIIASSVLSAASESRVES
jgi:hypothetical protein